MPYIELALYAHTIGYTKAEALEDHRLEQRAPGPKEDGGGRREEGGGRKEEGGRRRAEDARCRGREEEEGNRGQGTF